MQSHQRDLGPLVIGIGVADQSRMVKKLVESLASIARVHGSIHQFAQVLHPGEGLRRVFRFQQLDVPGTINQKFQDLSRTSHRSIEN